MSKHPQLAPLPDPDTDPANPYVRARAKDDAAGVHLCPCCRSKLISDKAHQLTWEIFQNYMEQMRHYQADRICNYLELRDDG